MHLQSVSSRAGSTLLDIDAITLCKKKKLQFSKQNPMAKRNEFDVHAERDMSDAKRWIQNSGKSRVLRPDSDTIALQSQSTTREASSDMSNISRLNDVIDELIATRGRQLATKDRAKLCSQVCTSERYRWGHSGLILVTGVILGMACGLLVARRRQKGEGVSDV